MNQQPHWPTCHPASTTGGSSRRAPNQRPVGSYSEAKMEVFDYLEVYYDQRRRH